LSDALHSASHRNMRGLVHLGSGEGSLSIAVVPLPETLPGGARPTLVMLGKRALCERLSVQWFARSHQLTPAETRVLEGLCHGDSPNEIAQAQGVAISTVRTQIGSIRTKTGVGSIRGLVRRIGLLPPLVTALRHLLTH
jgi:DNA-binding CsgD family transcriptional regulator